MDPKRIAQLAGVNADMERVERDELKLGLENFLKATLKSSGFPIADDPHAVEVDLDLREVIILLDDDPNGLDLHALNQISAFGFTAIHSGYKIRPYDNIRMEIVFTLKDNFQFEGHTV